MHQHHKCRVSGLNNFFQRYQSELVLYNMQHQLSHKKLYNTRQRFSNLCFLARFSFKRSSSISMSVERIFPGGGANSVFFKGMAEEIFPGGKRRWNFILLSANWKKNIFYWKDIRQISNSKMQLATKVPLPPFRRPWALVWCQEDGKMQTSIRSVLGVIDIHAGNHQHEAASFHRCGLEPNKLWTTFQTCCSFRIPFWRIISTWI